ncbi:MAG: TetR/AcrR family transcriptional regulator C-terminal domain-containing protein [Desertimonas sp.]
MDLATATFLAQTPRSSFDPDRWQDSVRRHCADIRHHYRAHPRILLAPLEEHLTPSGIDAQRIALAEDLLEFLTGIGLTLADAVATRNHILNHVFAFVLLVDHATDRQPTNAPRMRLEAPVPEAWLDAHPDTSAPLSRAALDLEPRSSDDMFDDAITDIIAALTARRTRPSR